MNNNLNKPITIVRAELISSITNLINESKLPIFVIEPILKDIYLEVRGIAQKQYEQDLINYNQLKLQQLKTDNNDSNDNGCDDCDN